MSTYDPLLLVELPAPGSQLNTWGTVLNNDTFTLLAQGIGGVATLTPSGPITLSTANGATDQGRMAILNCTSGTGGTITIPARSHVYQVRNGCSGNLVFTSGSGTTATVEPGSLATVFCDGTNCYRFADAADIAAALATAEAYTDAAALAAAGGNLPGQGGNAGKFLQTNGTSPSWVAVSSANVIAALGFTPQAALGYTPLNAAANLSDVGNVGTARTNLGVSQTGMDSAYNLKSANLSDVANAATARANLAVPSLAGPNTFPSLQTLSGGASITPAATPATNAVGYLGLPQTTHAGSYGPVMADAGCEQFFTATATATLPANGSVAYPIGTILVLSVDVGQTLTVAITTDTLRWLPGNSTGSRTVTGPGYLVAQKKKSGEWWATGMNIT